MCRRFTTVRVNVTGSSNDVGFGVAGQCIGLVPSGMPQGVRPSVGYWPVAEIEALLADVTVGGRTDQSHLSDLTLSVEAV